MRPGPLLRAAEAVQAASEPRLEAAGRFAARPVRLGAAAAPAGSGLLRVAAPRPAGRSALRAAAVGRAGSGRSLEAGRFAEQRPAVLLAAAAAPAGFGRRRAAARFAGRPVPQAAGAAPAGSVQLREAPHEAAHRVGSAPARVAREAFDRAGFAPRRAAAHPGAAVVAERAARWRVPVGREVRWRLAGVAGQALRAAARLELGAGRGAACRLPGAERLAQGAFRR